MHSLSKIPVDFFQEKKKMVAMSPSPVHRRQVVPSDLWEQFVEDCAKATKIVVVGKNRCRRNHFRPHRVVQMSPKNDFFDSINCRCYHRNWNDVMKRKDWYLSIKSRCVKGSVVIESH